MTEEKRPPTKRQPKTFSTAGRTGPTVEAPPATANLPAQMSGLSSKEGRKDRADMGGGGVPLSALVRARPTWETDTVKVNLEVRRVFAEYLRVQAMVTGRSIKLLMDDIMLSSVPPEVIERWRGALYDD